MYSNFSTQGSEHNQRSDSSATGQGNTNRNTDNDASTMNMNINAASSDAAAALIDSYFLPGGILDPDEFASNGTGAACANGNANITSSDNDVGTSPSQSSAAMKQLHSSNNNIGRFQQQQQQPENNKSQSLFATSANTYEASNSNVKNNNNNNNGDGDDVTMMMNMMAMGQSVGVGVSALDPSGDDVVGGEDIYYPNQYRRQHQHQNQHQHHQRGGMGMQQHLQQEQQQLHQHRHQMNHKNTLSSLIEDSVTNVHQVHHPRFPQGQAQTQQQQQQHLSQDNLILSPDWLVSSSSSLQQNNVKGQQQQQQQQQQQYPPPQAMNKNPWNNTNAINAGPSDVAAAPSASNENAISGGILDSSGLLHHRNCHNHHHPHPHSQKISQGSTSSTTSASMVFNAAVNTASKNYPTHTAATTASNNPNITTTTSAIRPTLSLSNKKYIQQRQGLTSTTASSTTSRKNNSLLRMNNSNNNSNNNSSCNNNSNKLTAIAPSSVALRPPPGFIPPQAASSSSLQQQQQQIPSHYMARGGTTHASNRSTQQQQQGSSLYSKSKHTVNNVQNHHHQQHQQHLHNHHHNQQQQQLQNPYLQSHNQHGHHQLQQHHHHHHHKNYDGDYDLASLNSKSSRDVPSTIYVRSEEEDAISNSEDTLTICADSSVTEVSISNNNINSNTMIPKKSEGVAGIAGRRGDGNNDRRMGVLEETSLSANEKRTKTKRQKKKRNKRRQQVKDENSTANEEQEGGASPLEENAKTAKNNSCGKNSKRDNSDKSTSHVKPNTDSSSSAGEVEKYDDKNRSWTSSTATATAVSSKATTVHRRVGKKSQHSKNQNQHQRDENKFSSRQDQYNSKKNAAKQRVEYVPHESISEKITTQMRKIRPVVLQLATLTVTLSTMLGNKCVKTAVSFCPQKERFWFFVPLFCICMDLFFLSVSMMCSIVGKLMYISVLLHKLALLELVEFDSATICYSLICFYPNIMLITKELLPFEEYWTVFFRWFAVDRWLCRPIKMKHTFLNRIKDEERRKFGLPKTRSKKERKKPRSFKDIVNFLLGRKPKDHEETERVTMANHILLILRKITPLILMIEVNVRRQGFLMTMSRTERILLSYGFTVIRSGYLFSPLIWMSWTLQLTVIMFAPASRFWAYLLMLVGLSAVRLSHYTAAVEDMEGIYVSYKNDDCGTPAKEKAE